MLPILHLISGALFALILFFLAPDIGIFNISILFLASILIDTDHYLTYIMKKKNLNLNKAYYWFKDNKYIQEEIKPHFLLHSLEILIPLTILSFTIFPILQFILLGFFFHMIFDISAELKTNRFHPLKYSLIAYSLTDPSSLKRYKS